MMKGGPKQVPLGLHLFIQKSPGEPLHCYGFESYRLAVAYAVWWMAPKVGFTPVNYDILELVQIDQKLVYCEELVEHRYWIRQPHVAASLPGLLPQAVRDRLLLCVKD